MKYLFFVSLIVHGFCCGSYVKEISLKLVAVHNNHHIQDNLFEQYKKAFVVCFCQKALAQQRDDIASLCGKYGLGQDWRNEMKNVIFPVVSEQHSEIACAVAQDMTEKLSDIADWLKANAS